MRNVELIDRLFTLSNRCAIGDGTAMTELIASYHGTADITAIMPLATAAQESTADLIRAYFDQVSRTCYVWYAYADELEERGDTVLALGGIRTVERETREDRETPVGWVFEVRGGKIAAARAYSSHKDAMAAVRVGSAPPAA